jgi:hypothetical protein
VLACGECLQRQIEMKARWDGNHDGIDIRIRDRRRVIGVGPDTGEPSAEFVGALSITAGVTAGNHVSKHAQVAAVDPCDEAATQEGDAQRVRHKFIISRQLDYLDRVAGIGMKPAQLGDMSAMTAAVDKSAELRPWVRRAVRVGYAAKGIIYLLIGTLALRLAIGNGGALTDSSGALRTIVQQPFGRALLAIVGVGILAYAGWEIAQGTADWKRQGTRAGALMSRGLTILKGAIYGLVGVQAVRMLMGGPSDSQDADDYARTAMEFPFGGLLLIGVGLGVVAYGISQVVDAWKGDVADDLDSSQLRSEGSGWLLHVGRAGIGARGIILILVGGALARAGFDERPSEASSMPEALSTLLSQPYGQWLLASIALGLMCFGLFQLLHARYARL